MKLLCSLEHVANGLKYRRSEACYMLKNMKLLCSLEYPEHVANGLKYRRGEACYMLKKYEIVM
jgi:hypothetical protein